jgi:hypothetical protein
MVIRVNGPQFLLLWRMSEGKHVDPMWVHVACHRLKLKFDLILIEILYLI